ncbi:MAG: AAA family ATPase [Candidatus Woesearchaeota archaeon]
MLIKSLKLQNIRSYVSQSIDFPKGSVLLAGDIGSGKSTILLAIEFALFGIMAGTLSGDALLRNGKKEGSVELKFDVEGAEFVIKRFLKKQSDRVGQSSGYIVRAGVKKEATPQELKSDILSILGYPKELLSRKNLIYRYTVYTPQEELKDILREDKEARLDTLRKLFGIDKYKHIRENTSTFIIELKQKSKLLEGKISDLDQKKSQKAEIEAGISRVDEKLRSILPELSLRQEELKKQSLEVARLEDDAKKCVGIRSQISLQDSLLAEKIRAQEKIARDTKSLAESIAVLEQELKEAPQDIPKLDEKKRQLEEKNALLQAARLGCAKLRSDLDKSMELSEMVWRLDKCPTCLQVVAEAHKKEIHSAEEKRSIAQKKELMLLQGKESVLKQEHDALAKDFDSLAELSQKVQIAELKRKGLKEKQDNYAEVQQNREQTKKEIGEINMRKLELAKELKAFDASQKSYDNARNLLERLRAEERKTAILQASFQQELQGLKKQLELVEGEIKQRTEAKKRLKTTKSLISWFEDFFVNLMIAMEKHVLGSVHADFNDIFQKWFRTLIEDEVLTVRLDDEFTPVIEQNGYEIELDHLSGGEKASVALSYRLSLNKVINDFMSTVKTRDLIILDEPTDGFSIEQLDKVRDVIEALKLPQVILVSHESKIETFVDKVIKVRKEEHVSTAVAD